MTVSVQFLAEHVEDVLAALSSGEAVQVARDGQSTLRLTASSLPAAPPNGPRVLGAGRTQMRPISWEEWKKIDREWKAGFLDEADVD